MASRKGSMELPPHEHHHDPVHAVFHTISKTFSQEAQDAGILASRVPMRHNDDVIEEDEPISKAEDWKMMPDIKLMKEQEKDQKDRKLGVTWKGLTVKGLSADAMFNENFLSQFNILTSLRERRHARPLKTILDNSHGCVKPGEMLLVLGRPGAGCTTLLNMLSNRRQAYSEVNGDVHFGSMGYTEAQHYRGQIVMNTEEEIFFPTLTVGETIDFATKLKVPHHFPSDYGTAKEYQLANRRFLLEAMGITHTADTKVGNEFVRGVSGGERKRVSIIECLATRGSIYCWDNSTRGLDASTALQYTQAVRAMTDVLGLSTIVTLYQAGNGIYNLFDKVLVLDEGKQTYYGPLTQARPFFENLGFVCEDSANVADFLTGVTVPTERRIREGFESSFPRRAEDIRSAYNNSSIKLEMAEEYDYPQTQLALKNTDHFTEAIAYDQHPNLSKGSNLTVSFKEQVKACLIRQCQIIKGDIFTFIIKQVVTLIQALIAGSLFYNSPNNSAGLFLKGGTLFFSVFLHTLMALGEVIDSFSGRAVLSKHKAFSFFHPAAFCISQLITDLPILLFQVTHFSIVIYFMVGLKQDAAAFFTYWIIVFATAMCMTSFFRAIGAASSNFDAAAKISGFLIAVVLMMVGYMIPKPHMHPWIVWIFWINPLAYAFEALMANELHGQTMRCVADNIIPSGPTYNNSTYQSCAGVPGAIQGATMFTGDQYLNGLSYSHSHVWRNFGIIWGWWFLFVAITVVSTVRWRDTSSSRGSLLLPRESSKSGVKPLAVDEESQAREKEQSSLPTSSDSSTKNGLDTQLIRNTSVFTWKNLTYTVNTPSGPRVLLDNVHGWIKPGMLGALMGSSGAGKTTLLDVLAQRKTEGTINASIMVDGRPLGVSFQRSAGYCEQMDVHEPLATVREALEFSALLRQSRDTPKEEKLKYVDTIIDLLELHDIEKTLIGSVGAGLSIEQRKRVTIGVELVSKPSILIFLDEPTSGLDGQAAYNIVRFLRRLADVGQAVLVTIHQPSASLFAQFDSLLLLARGGKTVYFGDIGPQASTVKEYFAKNGAPCPIETNPAEHMIDVVTGSASETSKTWDQIWLESPEHEIMMEELDRTIDEAASKEPGTKDDGFEFASTSWDQIKLVTTRMNIALYRNTEYVNNKMILHIISALFNGFSFWKIGHTVADLQLKLFTIFNFIFVAPGVISQLQPLFIGRRDLYEVREKKSKMYAWWAFVTGLIVSELPYLCICAVLYYACWYYTVGFPTDSNKAGATFFVMLFYEAIYTGIGQFIAAYAPNAVFASLINPLLIAILVSFCGVLVPYAQLQVFWRYWMYYLNPFNYLMGSILTFTMFDAEVKCSEGEFAIFDTPNGETCQSYLADYISGIGSGTNLINGNDTSACKVCQYRQGSDYLATINLPHYFDGWRDAGIVVIFAFSSYAMVYLLMKLRTKASKKAE